MKDVTAAVVAYLKAGTGIAGAVGQRVYRASFPAAPEFPLIVVTRIDTKRNVSHNKVRVGQSRIQCTAYANSDLTADTISELIADRLHGVDNTHIGLGVQAIRVDDAGGRTDSNPAIGKYLYHRDFMIQHYY